ISLFYYLVTRKILYPLLSLLLVLPFADSNMPFAMAALNSRPVLLLLLGVIIFIETDVRPKIDKSVNGFLLYFLILGYYLMEVNGVGNILRPVSYVLVVIIIPVVVKHLLYNDRDNLLRSIVFLYFIVYLLSFMNFGENTSLVRYGRFSGIFSNPNALGIFSFLFFMLSYIIFKFQGRLFNDWERYLVLGIILTGLLYSRSRSGIFAVAIFLSSIYIYERWNFTGLLFMIISVVIFESFFSFESFIRGLGLADFFRLESLETGSGRKIAMLEAWGKIKENPIDGYGIGFTERFFDENQLEMQRKGHAGSVHNSFLWVWLDMGLLGLLSFIWGWFRWFVNSFKYCILVLPVGLAVAFSSNVESWLVGSLNHVTIQLIIILCLLSNVTFLER
ncbi:O-antigen ligase family protein, partial [Acetoanaerobium noterae]|uniref:O-antigen ligase family protein n=1 Tax=Acetoanaerobium noterae TaxID=745369 RepID=UPI003221631B